MTLLYRHSDQREVGLHALLIGVGVYPHLDGGDAETKFSFREGLDQLSSPFHSVAAFADWLQNDQMLKDSPLRSLRVLASSDEGLARGWGAPTMSAIEQEVSEWFADANQHEGNFALFYFCGHGLLAARASAPDTSIPNATSISFLFEFGGKSILLAADAHPDVLVSAGKKLRNGAPIPVDVLKLPHHGSESNVSMELLDQFPAKSYVVSTNGNYHGHPDDPALARIIVATPTAEIIFNYERNALKNP